MVEDRLNVEDLTCGYGDSEVIRGADFVVERGDFVGIIGPNASGKSTLLRTINRVLEPKGGTVFLNGKDIGEVGQKEVAREMAAVPQEFNSNYSFTALEMVTLGRTPHLGPLESEGEEDMSVVRRSMEMTNTWYLHSRDFTELSGGEKQRVVIGKALAQEPSVLLLDEPTNHLDVNNQMVILDLLKDLTEKEEKCVVTTFHDLNTAARYCDSLILLHKKEIYAQGSPEEVLTEKNLKEVYGAEVSIRKLPETNSLYVASVSRAGGSKNKEEKKFRVHLICGGGSGSPLMHSLIRKNFTVSAGVLSPIDDDYKEASRLGVETVGCSPFEAIHEAEHLKNKKLAEKSEVVVLTDMPFGKGNLKNLKLAQEISKHKPTIVIKQESISEKDFTEGKAKELFSSLQEEAIVVKDVKEALSTLLKLEVKGGRRYP